jgi:hypothetical protein
MFTPTMLDWYQLLSMSLRYMYNKDLTIRSGSPKVVASVLNKSA